MLRGSRKSYDMSVPQELPTQIQTKEKGIKEAFSQRRYGNDRGAHEKLFTTPDHYRNTNKTHSDITSHTVGWPLSKPGKKVISRF